MKESIVEELNEIAKQNSGEPLTFTLIEHLRNNLDSYAQQIRESKKNRSTVNSDSTTQFEKVGSSTQVRAHL